MNENQKSLGEECIWGSKNTTASKHASLDQVLTVVITVEIAALREGLKEILQR